MRQGPPVNHLLLEPIKTALAAGDFRAARAERLRLILDLSRDLARFAMELDVDHIWEAKQAVRVLEMVDALSIPEET